MKLASIFNKFFLAAFSSAVLISCSGEPEFKVSGEIDGADNQSLILAKSDFHGRWIAVDSTRTNASGKFAIKSAAPASAEIYRLSLGDKFIYFPIDSTENITINSSAKSFGTDFTVEGSETAANMAAFEKELQKLDTRDPEKVKQFKRDVFNKYLKESRGSIIGYYVLTKIVDGKALYDAADRTDARYYAAVATSFDQFRPDDPHAGMLREISIEAMKRHNTDSGKKRVIEAEEVALIDIDLQNENGKNVKLSDVAGKGKPVVVIFSMMTAEDSPALNIALSELYNSKGGAVDFYHVSFDADQYAWRDAARNLKWTTVIDPAGQTSNVIRQYNVGVLPTFFIYNASGSLTDRAQTIPELKSKL